MQERYRDFIMTLPVAEQGYLRCYFNLGPGDLYDELHRDGLCQADVVLAFLRGEFLDTVNTIVPINRVPARPPLPLPTIPRSARVKKIKVPRHQSARTEWLRRLRIGMTLDQLLQRGNRRWVRWALRRKYVRMS